MKTKQQISEVLYQLDPMGTCCVENEVTDEYDDLADLIYRGFSVKHAFHRQFYVGCLNTSQLKEIKERLDAII